MAGIAAAEAARTPLWRDVRVLRIAGQAVFLFLVVWVLRELYLNLAFGVRSQGQDLSFEFLRSRAGFPIKEGISYSPNQPYTRAFLVGLVNTIRVAAVGIVLATLLGVVPAGGPGAGGIVVVVAHPCERADRPAPPPGRAVARSIPRGGRGGVPRGRRRPSPRRS